MSTIEFIHCCLYCKINLLYYYFRSYFSTNGSKYNFGRIPIGGSDFSTRAYTYDDTDGDVDLKKFTLANEDYHLKIPLMTEARKLNPSLRFLSAAWTAPVWMKNRPIYNGFSKYKKSNLCMRPRVCSSGINGFK